jgi:membrane-associated phospholipid phosphatase
MRFRLVAVLLGLFGVCAPARAQEVPSIQPVQLGSDSLDPLPRIGWLPRIEWPINHRGLLERAVDETFVLQPPDEPHPAPAHTGFKALVFETGSDFNAFPRRTSTWVILAIGGAAAAIAHPFDDEVTQAFVDSDAAGHIFVAGKWIGSVYVQAGTAVGLYVVGRYALPHADGAPKTNKVSHLGFDLLRALIVSQALTQGIKIAVQRGRPTGECCSFPSGHSSAAFATASVLERHLGYRGAWPTFAVAAYVAMSRLHDNRHFLSDVLFGGALGVASGWTVVGRHGRSNYAILPVPVPGGFMVRVHRSPSPRPAS